MNSDNPIKILFLASDPSDSCRLRLGQELRDIQERLQLARYRDKFVLEQRMSVRSGDISQAILDVEPNIVHFSGHGLNTGELCFENESGNMQPVNNKALAALFALFDKQVDCVILNACFSKTQAKAISKHIDFVIGMNQQIGDKAALTFAVGFYKALGAKRSIEEAFKFGCVEIQIHSIPEHLTPIIYKKKYKKTNLEQAKYTLVLSATIDEVNKPVAEAIIAHLRQISGDASLTLTKIEAGSVKLVLQGSQEGLERILALLNEGELTEILGFSVQDVQVLSSQEQVIAISQYQQWHRTSMSELIQSAQSGIVSHRPYAVATQTTFDTRDFIIMATVEEKILQYWSSRLAAECPEQSVANRESIISWLLGADSMRLNELSPRDLDIAKQAMEYRWRILQQRYLGKGRDVAYRNLITRLGGLVTLRNKIQTWVSLSRDRQRSVVDVLQEVIQELLQSDNYMLSQMASIAQFTADPRLKNALLFASVEEYCLRPIRNQPLLVYRFVNYLRRTSRGGLTQVPTSDLVKLVSEEVLTDDSDNRVNLVDNQAIADYQEAQDLEEQQTLRSDVKQEFENYLKENLGEEAVQWLRMYLQGKSQDAIAKKLNKPIKEIYRLREKISYHAVRVFALKNRPDLVDTWLGTSLTEHNFGLTPVQWEQLLGKLTPIQRQILELRKAGESIEAIAPKLKLKAHQAMGEWTKVYLAAQALRTED